MDTIQLSGNWAEPAVSYATAACFSVNLTGAQL